MGKAAAEKYLQQLNQFEYYPLKFELTKYMQLPFYQFSGHTNKKSKLCIVYFVVNDMNYFKYLYISLISQFTYTDILKHDIKLFFSSSLYHDAKELFSYMLSEDSIVEVPDTLCKKYALLQHEELSKYELVCFCDCDAFAYHPSEYQHNIYQKIIEQYTAQKLHMIMNKDYHTMDKVFYHRHKVLNNRRVRNAVQYVDFFRSNLSLSLNRLQTEFETRYWFLSCVSVYPRQMFEEADFVKFSLRCALEDFLCDETVFLMYALSKQYPVTDIDEIENVSFSLGPKFNKHWSRQVDKFMFFHPLVGTLCRNKNVLKLFDRIYSDYSKITSQLAYDHTGNPA